MLLLRFDPFGVRYLVQSHPSEHQEAVCRRLVVWADSDLAVAGQLGAPFLQPHRWEPAAVAG